MKNEKVDSLNKKFTDVQREVQSVSKCTADKEPKQLPQVEGVVALGRRSFYFSIHVIEIHTCKYDLLFCRIAYR